MTILLCFTRVIYSAAFYSTNINIYNGDNSGLTDVPDDIPAQTVVVHLEYNEITFIRANSFQSLSTCTKLYLSSNRISEIQIEAFKGMMHLKYLFLSWNNIKVRTVRRKTISMWVVGYFCWWKKMDRIQHFCQIGLVHELLKRFQKHRDRTRSLFTMYPNMVNTPTYPYPG